MGGKTEKHLDVTMNPSSIYYLHPTNIGLNLVNNVFKVFGFKGWKRAMSIVLSAKNKIGFVDGTVKRPTTMLLMLKHGIVWMTFSLVGL